ncbi:adenosylcobinamide-GDP ribazoletransferase [Marinisporobacter balticus]|uniref:Adenosylcobinamide-GDP ribazoletransferase n=1 Tax=Marinisporobacter balticus TaxID=2018667 RepID=A0A4R2LJF8_9FIRM|nr:adenosylcobinamide-GDP ribazoletransferase [Marinisporobacter balticus]TCO79505.1 cobalamin-5'-phosphate synthase [Marinisporobacter balticus]
MKKFVLILQFLTRIPININLKADEKDFSEGIIYFPLVGLIIGMFVVSVHYIGYKLGGAFLASVMAVIVEVFITGGLHLDGLGDTFDGVYSNRPKDRILEIMKDSRLGTNAALVIFLSLILKIAFINSLDLSKVYEILLLMPVFSRLCIIYGARFSIYARSSGMGNMFIGKTNNKHVMIAMSITAVISLINIWALPFMLIGLCFSLWYVRHISSKIGGMTGDTLGALCELSELVYLFYFLII